VRQAGGVIAQWYGVFYLTTSGLDTRSKTQNVTYMARRRTPLVHSRRVDAEPEGKRLPTSPDIFGLALLELGI
jgi:hypothetical protein